MAGDKAIQSAPIAKHHLHLRHEVGMMGRSVAHTERFTEVRSELVTKRDGQHDHQEQQKRLPPISFVAEDKKDKKRQRQPDHLS